MDDCQSCTLNSSKTEFLLIGLKQQPSKYTTLFSLQPTPLATFVLFSTNTLPSQIKSLHFLNTATITFVNFAVSGHYLDVKTASTIATSIHITPILSSFSAMTLLVGSRDM